MVKRKAPKRKKSEKMVTIGKGMKIRRSEEKKLEKRAGGSNVGEQKTVKKGDFAGPAGGSPKGSYPINTRKRAVSALKLAHNAPDPGGIKRSVYRKYPELAKRSKSPLAKRVVKRKSAKKKK